MNFPTCLMVTLFKGLSCLVGRDILIVRDEPDKSLFDFKRWRHDRAVCEYFGFGLRLIVSPLPDSQNRH